MAVGPVAREASASSSTSIGAAPVRQVDLATLLPVIVSAMTPLCLGYNAGVMSGAIGPMQDEFDLSDTQKGMIVGSFNLVAAPGAFVGGKLADWKGRVPSVMITAFIMAVGPVLMCTSTGFGQLFIGRILIGLGGGLSLVVAPLYGAEIAPPHIRAMLVSVNEILVNFGILLGYLSAMLLQIKSLENTWGWRLVIGLAMVPALFVMLCFKVLPESPRWLLKMQRGEDAQAVLHRLLGGEVAVTEELEATRQAIAQEQQEAGWADVLWRPTAKIRRMLIAGVGVAFFQQISGSEMIVYYTPTILKNLGMVSDRAQNNATIAVGVAKFLGACAGAVVLDVVGRRAGIMLSVSGLSLCIVGLALLQDSTPVAVGLALLCTYMAVFELGVAPGAFVLGTECYPLNIRAKGISLGMFTTRLLAGIVSVSFPPVVDAITLTPCLWIFFGLGIVGVPWAYFCVPETKGRTLEDVSEVFERPIGCQARVLQ